MRVNRKMNISFNNLSLIFCIIRGPICPPIMTPGTAQRTVDQSALPPKIKWKHDPSRQTAKVSIIQVAMALLIFKDNLLLMTGISHSPIPVLNIPLPMDMGTASHKRRYTFFIFVCELPESA